MDEDTCLRTPANPQPLDPDAEEHVSKKARVARNVRRIRGGNFDVNVEDWPNAGSGNSLKLRGCLDRRASRRQSQGRRRTRNHADERSAAVFLDQGGRRTS